ncbi:MAG: SRPBCC domain-containing protein [Methanoregulaceae archaeon]|nr:SRPBCC domain-containing protein [Methanoregulaceae archaeon]
MKKEGEDLITTRIFDAPVGQVWKAWTEPDLVKRWWGPGHFTATLIRIDLRVGGTYLWCMRSPEGQDYCNAGVYREIVPMTQIVYTQHFADDRGNRVPASQFGLPGDWPPEILVTATFGELGGKTELTMREAGIPDVMMELAAAGTKETLEKLAHVLETFAKSGGKESMTVDEFVKTRVLPDLQPVVTMLRELMHETAPDAIEGIRYGIPTYKGRRIFVFISPTKKDITFAFSRGSEFEDRYGLLKGRGKVSKHVKIKNLQGVNKDALRYYIRQARELDAG